MNFLIPNWPAPANIKSFTTTREGGVSVAPYDSFNLATHVGDNSEKVAENRAILQQELQLPAAPLWLSQVHGTTVLDAATAKQDEEADASFTNRVGVVCAVLTADCLPVLLCDTEGTTVAAVHAGWRGLLAGAIEATVLKMSAEPKNILAWYGPALGPKSFEVGADVRDAFIAKDSIAEKAFIPVAQGKWLCDIYALADLRLHNMGVTQIFGERLCTMLDSKRFYSYRRDNVTGRMASLIWKE